MDRRPEPASPRALRAWRRIGLTLGPPGAGLLSAAAAAWLITGRLGGWPAALVVSGLAAGLLAVVFLRRVWSEPTWRGTARSRRAESFSTAFLGLCGLAVALGLVGRWVTVPPWLRAVLACAIGVALVATMVAALRAGPEPARD
ncbi:DUF4175 domain-containing protein [Blastococcus saxobsidens]|uniref:DUF4175 domain-containing protein n=1 Tax=Blastococcus saxobsidens TaxID=138336 RepID=A0A6L9W309_9ACTN|nr:DUF4175 domain-containing protein [Blastococcus saxobsidens]NEK85830.1 DUF4175 domain-containing protein [Blastococcus saxobsidens]